MTCPQAPGGFAFYGLSAEFVLFLFVCLFVRSFVCLFVCLFVCWFVCLFVCFFVCLLACLFVCLLPMCSHKEMMSTADLKVSDLEKQIDCEGH